MLTQIPQIQVYTLYITSAAHLAYTSHSVFQWVANEMCKQIQIERTGNHLCLTPIFSNSHKEKKPFTFRK